MTPKPGLPSSAIESIHRSLSEICVSDENFTWENHRRFCGYAKRLQLILNQNFRSSPENSSPSVQTALKGLAGELTKARETLAVYRRSKIYVLINCQSLCASLQECAIAIGGWLALLDSALLNNPDLHKKTADLSQEMKQAPFRVTENEERVYCTLQKEGQGRNTSKAVQSAIIMDLARALGTDPGNNAELSGQIKLLKNDIARSNSVYERRILMSLERIFDNWSIQPVIVTRNLDFDFEDDTQILPFKNFICPLTKEVMNNPVVLESSQTYEGTAIEYWFERCIEDGRDPTCPVTGQVLKSLEQKPNIGLAGAIEEWVNRNIDIQIKSAVQFLNEDSPPVDCIERVMDCIYKISEEHPSSRYRVRNAGIVFLIIKTLKSSSKSMGSHLRSKVLMALFSMAKDEESKQKMLEEGMSRLAVHSLTGSSEKEREYAIKLLLEFSSDESYCAKLAAEKGALVLLSSMAGNLEHPALSNLAEEVLTRMEKVEDNVRHLAAAGRFEPLLRRLSEGADEVRIEMASIVGMMTLTKSSKEQIAQQSAKILVDMLSKPEGRTPSLQALYNLSALDDNATMLVDSAVLPALTEILFKNQDFEPEWQELAASIIANIVSNPGHWELESADREGHSMQSEHFLNNLLRLLSISSPRCQVGVLRTICGIASSPQASGLVAMGIESVDGITAIIPFLEHQEIECRIYAFKLTRILSEKLGEVLANKLRACNKVLLLKDKLLDNQCTEGERSDAACILANLPLSDDEVKQILGTASLVRLIITNLKEQCHHSSARNSRPTSSTVEGLVGLLLHLTRSIDPTILGIVREHRLMVILREQLSIPSQPRVKQQAALGLKYLSESGHALIATRDSEPQPPNGLCSSLTFMCGRAPMIPVLCPIHNAPCEEEDQFCLLKSNSIKPLVDLLNDDDTNVQVAAVEALSTVVSDNSRNLKQVVDELEHVGAVDGIIALFTEVRPGELQEKVIWMVERVLRVEGQTQQQSVNQTLVRALVDALRHGNANTRKHAQDALTNLKQLSGVSGKTSSQPRPRR